MADARSFEKKFSKNKTAIYETLFLSSLIQKFNFYNQFQMKEKIETDALDYTDLQLLDTLQRDASLSNQALAERLGLSAPTCLRRVRRLHTLGLIERAVTVLSPERMAALVGHGLQALVEITLDRQDARRWTLLRHWPWPKTPCSNAGAYRPARTSCSWCIAGTCRPIWRCPVGCLPSMPMCAM